MTSPETIERITRSLAYMLRHQPAEFGLELDPYGWADVDDVLRALQERTGETYEFSDLDFAVHAGDRPRYEIQDGRIRALYGHSIEVLPGEPSRPPEFLYVGIDRRDADRAVSYGLKSGRRRFLHLAKTPDDARDAARRAGREWAILTIFALDAWEEGVNFYDRKSLFLAESVPTDYLEIHESGSDGFEPVQRERGGEHHGGRREHGHRRHGQGQGRFSEPRRRDEPGRGRDSERAPDRDRSPERAREPERSREEERHREPERARELDSERPREAEEVRGGGRSAGSDRPRREWTERPPREGGAAPRGRPERSEQAERDQRPPERSGFAASGERGERGGGASGGRERQFGSGSTARFQDQPPEGRTERNERQDRGGERPDRSADRGGDRGRHGSERGERGARSPERSGGERLMRDDRPRHDAPAPSPAPRDAARASGEPQGDFGSGIFEPRRTSEPRPERERPPEREAKPAPPRPRAEPPPPADDFGAGV